MRFNGTVGEYTFYDKLGFVCEPFDEGVISIVFHTYPSLPDFNVGAHWWFEVSE
jgi:hypothetical protein